MPDIPDRLKSTTNATNNSTIYNFGAALASSVRPTQFRVSINVPSAVWGRGWIESLDGVGEENINKTLAQINFLTHTAQLPAYRTDDCLLHYRGRPYHESGERSYDTWNCTIYNSGDFSIRKTLERWVELMHSTNIVWGETDPRVYKGSVTIEQLDRKDTILRTYRLIGAWVSDTGTVELSYENGTQVETFSPTFIYDYFIVGNYDSEIVKYDNAYAEASTLDTGGNLNIGGSVRA